MQIRKKIKKYKLFIYYIFCFIIIIYLLIYFLIIQAVSRTLNTEQSSDKVKMLLGVQVKCYRRPGQVGKFEKDASNKKAKARHKAEKFTQFNFHF